MIENLNIVKMDDKKEIIDIRDILKTLKSRKKLFWKTLGCAFVLSCIWIFPKPRTYSTNITVAPEMADMKGGGSLSSIASSFGINLNDMTTTDAFYPDIYPDIISTNEFIAGLMTINVKTIDNEVNTTYYEYLKKHQKSAFYEWPFKWVTKRLGNLMKPAERPKASPNSTNNANGFNIFMMSADETALFDKIRNSINCSVDKKNGIITISVEDQDPLICAIIADSTRVHLQDYITKYRTNKARIDYDYYQKLTVDAKTEYDLAQRNYSHFVDSHLGVSRQAEQSTRDALENDLSIKLTTYNTMYTQMVAARSKIQEATPAFTLLKSATVPVRPSGPKRMIFIFGMLFLTTLGTIAYIFKRDILDNMMHGTDKEDHS